MWFLHPWHGNSLIHNVIFSLLWAISGDCIWLLNHAPLSYGQASRSGPGLGDWTVQMRFNFGIAVSNTLHFNTERYFTPREAAAVVLALDQVR